MQNVDGTDSFQNKTDFEPRPHGGSKPGEKSKNALLRPSSAIVTDGLCIKDTTTIDPACGSSNFLTETHLPLRKLENEVLQCLTTQISTDLDGIIQVSIGQFFGIVINDFAMTVAKTALWITESQIMKETEDVVHMTLNFLPLKSYANITDSITQDEQVAGVCKPLYDRFGIHIDCPIGLSDGTARQA